MRLLAVTVAALAATFVTCSPLQFTLNFGLSTAVPGDGVSVARQGSIIDVLRQEKKFSRLVKALEENAGLQGDLEGPDKVTLFAPTDEAWEYMEETLRQFRGKDGRRRRRVSDEDIDLNSDDVDTESRKGGCGRRLRVVGEDADEVGAESRDDGRPCRADDDEEADSERRKDGRRRRRRVVQEDVASDSADDVDQELRKGDRRRGRHESGDKDEERRDMEEILRYHIVREELTIDDLFDGKLLTSELRESGLSDHRQKIRVFKFLNKYFLNMYAHVGKTELRADNGYIHAIDHVLCPPLEAGEMMGMLPVMFSTFLTAIGKTGMMEKIEDEKSVTIFAPDNGAWTSLGMQNMMWLFSPHGRKDLKRIVEYHIGRDLLHSTEMMKDRKLEVDTLLQGEKLEISTCERPSRGGGGDGGDEDRHNRRNRNHRKRSADIASHRDDRERHGDEMPSSYMFLINKGEAKINEYATDFLAENAVIQPINAVMIPRDVELPFAFDGGM